MSIESSAPIQFYTWKNYRCAYQLHHPDDSGIPLVLIHPIGVGLSGNFWYRFCKEWYEAGNINPIYNPDLLGCGDSEMPRVTYSPQDWAEQVLYFIQTVVKKPVIIVTQGALFPVAIKLVQLDKKLSNRETPWIQKLALSGPPGWKIMTRDGSPVQNKLRWNLLFDTPLGTAFYRYARSRKFLKSFSIKQLFENPDSVDKNWLDMLEKGAANLETRHAVFAFLAGFWREDYEQAIASIQQPTLVVIGQNTSNISREGLKETPDERLAAYLNALPNGKGVKINGRNVLPYEETAEFVQAIAPFIREG
ncbi:alpha/beta fold hydrolase [Laspinema olomoucense]|uniref:alpha/beta fold hydrolase n=1 Tax=Laspinema olomoucense TaxID=3231600 RepID=UPI0021BAA0CE|nr:MULTISPECIES: alpha/beta hydrolase [unclassified Laspinema]MCT7975420.1 alpha/beta hydrolase [Laspinema sp. D3d]MCT7996196.1 alpha/beta hydrolase [Laspinema sp. D3c]